MRNLREATAPAARLAATLALVFSWAVTRAAETLRVDGRDYADLAEAVAAVGEENAAILVAAPLDVRQDLAVGANVQLVFLHPGCLMIAPEVTVTIGGSLEAPLVPIFAGEGNATIAAANTSIAQVYPQWWGARGDDRNDDTGAIQQAIDAARDMGGGEVIITSGTFRTTSTIYLWGVNKWDNDPRDRRIGTRGIHLSGVSRRASVIHFTGVGPALWLYTSERAGVRYYHAGATVRCLHLLGANAPDSTGLRVSAPRLAGSTGGSACVENCAIDGFDVGLHIEHSYGALFSYNKIRYNNTGVQVGSPEAGGVYNINGNSFRDNEVSLNRHVGLRIYNGNHNLFEGGLIEGNGDEGIYIERTGATESGYLTFRNIWIEANQRNKAAGELGQVYLHSTVGAGYRAQHPVTFERCFLNSQGENYHMRLGNTIGLQLNYNQFSHPNDRIIARIPGTSAAWAIVRTANEDQNKVIQGVLASGSGAAGDVSRDDIAGTRYMPHAYFPANSAKSALAAEVEADARTHSSIASAAGVFTTQHLLSEADRDGAITLPRGAALIGISVCTGAAPGRDVRVALMIDGRTTSLEVVLPKGRTTAYRTFSLTDYKKTQDWVSGNEKPVLFSVVPAMPEGSGAIRIVAFWRSNHLPVF